MGMTLQKRTSPTAKNFSKVLREWLTIFGEIYRQEVTATRMRVYRMALEQKLTAEQLELACQLATETCNFFPTPAEILSAVKTQVNDQESLDGERAWENFQEYILRWGTDRTPLFSGGRVIYPPDLDPATEYALRQVGGVHYVGRLPEDQVFWVRKNFLESYKRFNETDGLKQIPGREELRELLQKYAPALAAKPELEVSNK